MRFFSRKAGIRMTKENYPINFSNSIKQLLSLLISTNLPTRRKQPRFARKADNLPALLIFLKLGFD